MGVFVWVAEISNIFWGACIPDFFFFLEGGGWPVIPWPEPTHEEKIEYPLSSVVVSSLRVMVRARATLSKGVTRTPSYLRTSKGAN